MSIYSDIRFDLINTYNTNKFFGFFISGGFDSALLFYFSNLLKSELNLPAQFSVFTVPRHDDSIIHSQRVVDWVNSKFNRSYVVNSVGNPDLHHSKQVGSGFDEAIKRCHFIVLSGTQNPEHMKHAIGAPVRGPIHYPTFRPFLNYNKSQTVELANELGIINDIAAISHTCTENKLSRCTCCWQCRERAWGFQDNNFIDIGTM